MIKFLLFSFVFLSFHVIIQTTQTQTNIRLFRRVKPTQYGHWWHPTIRFRSNNVQFQPSTSTTFKAITKDETPCKTSTLRPPGKRARPQTSPNLHLLLNSNLIAVKIQISHKNLKWRSSWTPRAHSLTANQPSFLSLWRDIRHLRLQNRSMCRQYLASATLAYCAVSLLHPALQQSKVTQKHQRYSPQNQASVGAWHGFWRWVEGPAQNKAAVCWEEVES